jgi:hypothetical protein
MNRVGILNEGRTKGYGGDGIKEVCCSKEVQSQSTMDQLMDLMRATQGQVGCRTEQ